MDKNHEYGDKSSDPTPEYAFIKNFRPFGKKISPDGWLIYSHKAKNFHRLHFHCNFHPFGKKILPDGWLILSHKAKKFHLLHFHCTGRQHVLRIDRAIDKLS